MGRPTRVDGMTSRSGALDCDIDDLALLQLTFADAAYADICLSMCRRDYSRGFEFVGKKGTLSFDFSQPELMFCGAERDVTTLWSDSSYDNNQMYIDMLRDMLTAALEGAEPPVPLDDGILALRTISALQAR